jgi:hypothetical protein
MTVSRGHLQRRDSGGYTVPDTRTTEPKLSDKERYVIYAHL